MIRAILTSAILVTTYSVINIIINHYSNDKVVFDLRYLLKALIAFIFGAIAYYYTG